MVSRCLLLGAMLAVSSLPAGADDWPQFRGPGRDNKVTGFTAPATWPKELKKEWKVPAGDGVASPILVGDRVYVFVREGGEEALRCLDAATGKEIWKEKYKEEEVTSPGRGFPGQEPFSGPRATPAAGEGKICTMGAGGTVSCFDAATGKVLWRHETKMRPVFFTSCSPVIAEGKCIVHIGGLPEGAKGFGGGGKGGGKGELMAYNLADGKPTWKWSGDAPGYGSPVLATIHGVKQVVELTDQNLVGVSLADGKLLWKTALKTGRYQSHTPVIDGNTVICGGTAFEIEKLGDEFKTEEKWAKNPPATYNTPVLKDGVLYGLVGGGGGGGKGGGGKGGGAKKGPAVTRLFAQDAKTGDVLWTNDVPRGECGAVLDAGDVLLLMSSDMNLVPFKPDRKEFKELARYKVADLPAFAMPIVAGDRIYVKDRESLFLWKLN
jgi:outer membrane protein assembly factor BamB